MTHKAPDRKCGLITFEGFKTLAKDRSLDVYERIGFPDALRRGREADIFADITAKLPALNLRQKRVLEIGPGCGALPKRLIRHCVRRNHQLTLVDSREMLDQLPDARGIRKHPARFPECPGLLREFAGKLDALIAYSMFQNIFIEGNEWDFLDRSLALLAPGGRLLIGDIPNLSKYRRSGADAARPLADVPGSIDDAVVIALLLRGRSRGFHAYVLPQADGLPYAGRREDLLFIRPGPRKPRK
jgi:hypothetical protein